MIRPFLTKVCGVASRHSYLRQGRDGVAADAGHHVFPPLPCGHHTETRQQKIPMCRRRLPAPRQGLPLAEEKIPNRDDYADKNQASATVAIVLLLGLRWAMGTNILSQSDLTALSLGGMPGLGVRPRLGLRLRIRLRRRPRIGAEPILLRLLVLGRDFVHDLSGVNDER